MKDVYSLILTELKERGCAYVDRFPPYYIASTGCHLFNLMNQQREVLIEGGRVRDTRLHVIFCSPPGFSKCHTKGTMVNMSDGSYKAIEDVENGDTVISLNDKFEVVNREVLGTIKLHSEKIIKITTRTGRVLRQTPEHPLRTITGWKKAEELKLGERLAVIRTVPTEKSLHDENRLCLLAALITEGSTSHTQTVFSQNEENQEYIQIVRNAVEGLGGRFIQHPSDPMKYGIQGLSRLVTEWHLRGKTSSEKSVPEFVFRLHQDQIAKFLYWCWLGDGLRDTHYWSEQYTNISSISPQLRKDYQRLFSRIGVIASVEGTKVAIYGQERDELFEIWKALGLIEDYKREPNRQGSKKKDVIPADVKQLFPEEFKKTRFMRPSYYNKNITKRIFLKVVNTPLARNIVNNVMWDEIVSIETEHGSFDVYDLKVDDTKSYVAEDISTYDTYWIEQFLRGEQAILLGSGIDITLQAAMTDAGFVGTTRFSEGESVREPGLAEEHHAAICGIEEFAAVTNMFRQSYSGELDTALLQALDSGYVYKRLASGSISYRTCITLHTGSQPTRFDLSSGLGRRFIFIEFIPMRKDFRMLTIARRQSRGINYNPARTTLIRDTISEFKAELSHVKEIDIDDAFFDLMDREGIVHYEEALYEKMLLGFSVMSGNMHDDTLFMELTPTAEALLLDEVQHRKNIKKGSEFSQVFAVLGDAGGGASLDHIRDMLLDYGCDYAQSTELIELMLRIKLIHRMGRNIVLPGYSAKKKSWKK